MVERVLWLEQSLPQHKPSKHKQIKQCKELGQLECWSPELAHLETGTSSQ